MGTVSFLFFLLSFLMFLSVDRHLLLLLKLEAKCLVAKAGNDSNEQS